MKPGVHDRNQLVDFGENPQAPEPPDIGVAIKLVSDTESAGAGFLAGHPIVLTGSYRVDGKLYRECEQNPAAAITITLTRQDRPFVQKVPLYSPKSKVTPPGGETAPVYGEGYRVGGQFRLDLRLFFGLPDEPGKYTVLAELGGHQSRELSFEVHE